MKIINGSSKYLKSLMLEDEATQEGIENKVKKIIKEVKEQGNTALLRFAEQYDNVLLKERDLIVSEKEIKEAYSFIGKKELKAFKKAKKKLELICKKQMPKEFWIKEKGIKIGELVRAIEKIGVYVPSGKYPYPSSVFMNVVPAKVAGCREIIMCSPPRKDGKINPFILVAADLCEVNKIIKAGGAQAIAAMAYGTKNINKVDKIVGPGNIFVSTAKKMVFGKVGIDSIAGPSEILVLARKGNAKLIAAELLCQAEHDENAKCVFITSNEKLAQKVNLEIGKQLPFIETKKTIKESFKRNGRIVITKTWNEAVKITNELAPEHLFITGEKNSILKEIKCAGSIFIGEYSPVAAGDYCSGTNHTLPTGRTARFSSGLSVRDFLVMPYVQKISKKGLEELKETLETFAEIEGLAAHKNSVIKRFEGRIDAVIFDVDGVLIDVRNSYREAVRKSVEIVIGKKILRKEVDEVKKMIGMNNDWDAAFVLLKKKQGKAVKFGKINRKSDEYRKLKDVFQGLYQGGLMKKEKPLVSRKFFEELKKKKLKLGIVSGRPRNELAFVLKKEGFGKFFGKKAVIAMEDCVEQKPSGKPLLKVLKTLNAKNALYVGDSVDDVLAAKNAGIKSVFVGKEKLGDYNVKKTEDALRWMRKKL